MAFLEISKSKITKNIDKISSLLAEQSAIIAVVKANAYGLGAIGISKYLEKDERIKYLAVGRLEEALELREHGIKKAILVFANIDLSDFAIYQDNNIDATVSDEENLKLLATQKSDRPLNIHIKVNTGMNRLGISYHNFYDYFNSLTFPENIDIKTIYSHYANSDELRHPLNDIQSARFLEIQKKIKLSHPQILFHMANSGAILNKSHNNFDFVRSGILIFGHLPNPYMENKFHFESVFELKARVLQVMSIKEAHAVGYGSSYIAKETTRIASISVGYADGYSRKFSNQSYALFKGQLLRTIGNVSMDQLSIEIPKGLMIKNGDIVSLYSDSNPETSLNNLAAKISSLQYELLTSLSARVKRIYKT